MKKLKTYKQLFEKKQNFIFNKTYDNINIKIEEIGNAFKYYLYIDEEYIKEINMSNIYERDFLPEWLNDMLNFDKIYDDINFEIIDLLYFPFEDLRIVLNYYYDKKIVNKLYSEFQKIYIDDDYPRFFRFYDEGNEKLEKLYKRKEKLDPEWVHVDKTVEIDNKIYHIGFTYGD